MKQFRRHTEKCQHQIVKEQTMTTLFDLQWGGRLERQLLEHYG